MKKPYKIRLSIAAVVLFLTTLAVIGFYPVSFLDLQFSPLIQRCIYDFSVFAFILISLIILSAIIFGRFYCSTLCPFGIAQEVANLIYYKIRNKKLPDVEYTKPKPVKYFISAAVFGFLISGSTILIKYIDPYTIFASWVSLTIYGIIFISAVLILVFFKNRFFCTSICPVGAILGLLAKLSPFGTYMDDNCIQCGMCARYCPSKCIDKDNKKIDNENCIRCLKCISICPKGAMKYGLKLQKPKFNTTKRQSVIKASAALLFIAACGIGIKFSKNIYSKLKDIIVPPGAKNAQRMANKCLNCNLCINNCPMGILQKANSTIPMVHIDYSKGSHYCDYDCKKCSDSCPSGAIKKITLKEKQNIRIAMASINDNCIACSNCVNKCPRGAIKIINSTAKIDASKCIGCGACKAVCPMSAVEIYPIKEQTEI